LNDGKIKAFTNCFENLGMTGLPLGNPGLMAKVLLCGEGDGKHRRLVRNLKVMGQGRAGAYGLLWKTIPITLE